MRAIRVLGSRSFDLGEVGFAFRAFARPVHDAPTTLVVESVRIKTMANHEYNNLHLLQALANRIDNMHCIHTDEGTGVAAQAI